MMYPVHKVGVSLNELPDCISFYIQLHSCKIKCSGCHSTFLWNDTGSYKSIDYLIEKANINKNNGCDSIIIFGDINNNVSIFNFNNLCRELSNILPLCVYSGADTINKSLGDISILKYLSYIKLGHFDINLGGLSSISTNQRLYVVNNGKLDADITYKFWR